MSDILRRAWAPLIDLEVRQDEGGEGRLVRGLAAPFDTPTSIHERGHTFDEVFRMGAFADTIIERGDRVKFLANHNKQKLPIGKAVSLREDAAGLVGEFFVPDTAEGNDVLELIRAGVVDSLSVGFIPQPDGTRGVPGRDPIIERIAVKLMEVSAVAFPAYENALITGLRYNEDLTPDQGDESQDLDTDHVGAAPDQGDAPDQRPNRERVLDLLDLDLRRSP